MPCISLWSMLGNCRVSFNHYAFLHCAALLKHLSYTTYAPSKRPKKITLHLKNVCFEISQLDKNNFKDALFGRPKTDDARGLLVSCPFLLPLKLPAH